MPQTPTFVDFLTPARTEPGQQHQADTRFHNYILDNQLLAWAQCLRRGLEPGPMEEEAGGVALLVLGSLNQPGLEHCRGYIQHWLKGAEIPEHSAQRIFKAADPILRAGGVEYLELRRAA